MCVCVCVGGGGGAGRGGVAGELSVLTLFECFSHLQLFGQSSWNYRVKV